MITPTDYVNTARKLGLRKLSGNIGRTLARQMIAAFLNLGTVVLIARILGPEGNGQYSIAILLPTLLSTFLNLGVAPANVYYIGRRTVSPRVAASANARTWGMLTLIGMIIASILITFFNDGLFPGVPIAFLWMALMTFPIALLQNYLVSILQGLQDFRRFNLAVLMQPAVTLALAASFLLSGGGVFSAVSAFFAGNVAALAGAYMLLRTELKRQIDPGQDAPNYFLESVRYGYKAHLSNILAFVNYKADIFLVNLLLNPAAAGIYVVAVQLTERLWMLSQAVSTVILPRLSELHKEEDVRKELTPLVGRWVLLITFLGGLVLALVAYPLIELLFGENYTAVVQPLLVLLPGIVLGSLSRILANDIAARGRPELNMFTAIIVVIANIIGNIILIPRLGILGAAIATTAAYTINMFLRIFVYAFLSGNPWYAPFWNKRIGRAEI